MAADAAGVADSLPPPALSLGSLALAARSYWRCSSEARADLRFLALYRGAAEIVRREALSDAVERIEHLREMADTGHPLIRERAERSVAPLLTALQIILEPRP